MARPDTRPPTGKPLVGRVVRLDPMVPQDAAGLFHVLSDPLVFAQGYRMSNPLTHPDEAARVVAAQVAARPGRTAYKLGAVREGVLRRMVRRADGSWRDTVVYSILVDEWPAVRSGLERRLTASCDARLGPPPGSASRH